MPGIQYYVPFEFSLQLAESYARYFCRRYGAESAEVIRHKAAPIHSGILYRQESQLRAGEFGEITHSFGRLPQK